MIINQRVWGVSVHCDTVDVNIIGSDPIGGVESGGVAGICEGHPFFATGKMPVVPVNAIG